MTPAQIAVVRQQFGMIAPQKDVFAALFYDKLFDSDPMLRPMFPADMRPQRAKLIQALAHVILSLDNLGAVLDDVRSLGMRHAAYGVEANHYALVGETLLAALAETLGARFDAKAEAAWALAYGIVSDAMIEAAADLQSRQAAE
ncbi:hemin receptor [Phreatobacter aquaticus]|uniref:Hemin receptor n=1 Tax=Phreatobacter aquaticus TaxID=2570229 RepID=A0A4D7QB24_9HYPH|nr:globin domain-containing protein [Phreatobacter aquaticus]QCK85260.1 hemin receptor [Phreatobacter aquaticus]